ncbi:MAG: nuclear transport factor 2 family protein [Microbacterium sp.]|nr:MAG: nuclear transport factor 2 family protein [Microbacterium sp.]
MRSRIVRTMPLPASEASVGRSRSVGSMYRTLKLTTMVVQLRLCVMTNYDSLLRDLYAAISAGATGPALTKFWHPDAEQIEYPSVMRPAGHRRSLEEMAAGAELGAQVIRDQCYDVHTVIEEGEQVAVQLTWTATVATDLGSIRAGTHLTAHVAAFYVFRDGLLLRQSSYDCYEPIAG